VARATERGNPQNVADCQMPKDIRGWAVCIQPIAAEDLAETLGIVFATGDRVNAIPVSRATIATASNEHC